MSFTTPFWGSSWREATPRAIEQDADPQELAPCGLTYDDSFFYEGRRFIVHNPRCHNGLVAAVEMGHETGVMYMFHPDDLAGLEVIRAPSVNLGLVYIVAG